MININMQLYLYYWNIVQSVKILLYAKSYEKFCLTPSKQTYPHPECNAAGEHSSGGWALEGEKVSRTVCCGRGCRLNVCLCCVLDL